MEEMREKGGRWIETEMKVVCVGWDGSP